MQMGEADGKYRAEAVLTILVSGRDSMLFGRQDERVSFPSQAVHWLKVCCLRGRPPSRPPH